MTNPTPRPDAHPIDSFTDWLDAGGPGMAPPAPSNAPDADIADICHAAHQLHDLDVGFRQYAATVSSRSRIHHWEDIMQTHPALATPTAVPVSSIPRVTTERRHWFSRSWQVAINATLAAVLILGLGIGLWREFGPSTPLPWQDGSPGNPNGLIPSGTPDTNDTESSSIPYPTAAECTVTPLTKEQVRAFYETANVDTEPIATIYEQPIVPSEEDASAIMATYRMWQACLQGGKPSAYLLSLETPWIVARTNRRLQDNRPVSERTLDLLVELALADGPNQQAIIAQYPDLALPEASVSSPDNPSPRPTFVPIPAGATPIASPTSQDNSRPTLFAKDIAITGPDRATATAYFVDPETMMVTTHSPVGMQFVKVDGKWLLDSYGGQG